MELNQIRILIESFRKELIGAPSWITAKHVFEYDQQTVQTVAVLKLIRATQGLTTLDLLYRSGLVIDLGASIRALNDSVDEVYFLLETYPGTPSVHVDQFVTHFFENTIDAHLDTATHQVGRDKIRSAVVRVLKGRHDDATQKMMVQIYKAFSGYTHAGYVHIMEVYNGAKDSFNLAGIPSEEVRRSWSVHFGLACEAVIMAAAFAAQKFNKENYFKAMMKALE